MTDGNSKSIFDKDMVITLLLAALVVLLWALYAWLREMAISGAAGLVTGFLLGRIARMYS